MKRMIALLLAVLMICALTVSAYADVIHTDASPSLPSLGSALFPVYNNTRNVLIFRLFFTVSIRFWP